MAIKIQKGSGSAVDLSKVREAGHVDLAKRAEKAGISLSKRGLDGIRAQVEVYLDFSGSMRYHYQGEKGGVFRSGKPAVVQTLTDRLLGFGMQVDGDGEIPVYRYHNDLVPNSSGDFATTVGVSNYEGVVDRELAQGRMGGTEFAPPLRQVLKNAKKTDLPMFVFFVTDGSPSDRTETIDLVCELADYPVFIKFAAVADDGWPFLDKLNNLETIAPNKKRTVDNVNAVQFYGDTDVSSLSDLDFIDKVIEEWDDWFEAATKAGILNG